MMMKWWLWQHHHTHLNNASADFKHYAKKTRKTSKFFKKKFC